MPTQDVNLAALTPSYVLMRETGVHVQISGIPSQEALREFADRLFNNGAYFVGLIYPVFMELLYGNTPLASLGNGRDEIKFAERIAPLPSERMELYKGLKIERRGESAEYLFEPPFLEVKRSEPVFGLPDAEGKTPIVSYRDVIDRIPTELRFDEFVASLWVKELRFGIDEGVVEDAIRTKKVDRILMATQRLPTDSCDAEIKEESDRLHQDRAPLVLPDGRIDLRRARNRFPQVSKDAVLLRKIPRTLGNRGFRVTGAVIEPRHPKDVDLNRLAGEGTRIENTAAGDVLIANRDGFFTLDHHSGQVSVSTKIVNREGVSIRSTGGDITLDVEDFTEHGEVQEGRVVEGLNLNFMASVFGTVISHKGKILIKGNLSGGRAHADAGSITVKGKAINSRVEAIDGEIHIEIAEECTLIGRNVTVGQAVNCEIVADTLEARTVESCAIGGKHLHIGHSGQRKFDETIVSLVLPDIAALDLEIDETREALVQLEQELKTRHQRMIDAQSNEGFSHYLLLKEKIEAGKVQLNAKQQEHWEKMVARFAPLEQMTVELIQKIHEMKLEIEAKETHRNSCGTTEYCQIDAVQGDTVVQRLVSKDELAGFYPLSSQQIKLALRHIREKIDRIFSGNTGNVDYHHAPQ